MKTERTSLLSGLVAGAGADAKYITAQIARGAAAANPVYEDKSELVRRAA